MKSWIAALLLPSAAIAAPQLNVAGRYYGNDTQAEVYSVNTKFPTASGAAPTAWGSSTGYTVTGQASSSPTATAASSGLSPYPHPHPHGTGVPDRHHWSYSSAHPAVVTHSTGSIYIYTTYDPVYPASTSTSTSTSSSSSSSTQEPATWTTYTKSHPTATSTSTGYCAHPGTYECTYSHADGGWGWAVCDVSYNWVHAGLCGTGQTCTLNAENASPYCM